MTENADRQGFESSERKEFLPICDDARIYLEVLRGTPQYQAVIDRRVSEAMAKYEEVKAVWPDLDPPTREEIRASFEELEEFKQLFWDFEQDVLHLAYNREKYSAQFNKAFRDYTIKAVDSLFESEVRANDADQMREKDLVRSRFHNAAADALVEGKVVPNQYVGRIIVRAFLVDEKKDHIPSARLSDRQRVARNLDRRTLMKYWSNSETVRRLGNTQFTPENIGAIQESFLDRYSGCFVGYAKRDTYLERPFIPNSRDTGLPSQGDQENQDFKRRPIR